MRSALLIVIVISLLIVGILVARNISTDTAENNDKLESIQKAKDAAKRVEDKIENIRKRAAQPEDG